ncbi:MAG: hypothetical protein JWM18_3381 [Chloroflexi bacterium]|jgi:hypothetical protein|nr:hypothetical protein [Chloroflexota bacterium]MEA2566462.1 hypothetical protein [Actinomycetota bacterium]
MRPLQRTVRVLATAVLAAGTLAAGGGVVAEASSDPSYCTTGMGDQPCRGCPGDPQGPCTAYDDSGRIDIGQKCCDPACVNFKGNPGGEYEDYVWVYGWSYHNRVTGQDYRQSYIGGKGGTVGPWTEKGQFHQPICD